MLNFLVKDKYGDVDGESDESTDESEDDDAIVCRLKNYFKLISKLLLIFNIQKELTKDVEIEFFKALSLVKSKDTKIYDKEKCKFFENMSEQTRPSEFY